MKKKNIFKFCFYLVMLIAIVSVTFFCTIKFSNKIDRTIKRDVIVTENGLSEGIDNIYDSVVVVETYSNSSFDVKGTGTGFIISNKGYIITNQHVIDKANDIKIILTSGVVLNATLIGQDEYDDIAVLQIDSNFVNNIAKIGNSENIKLGDTVFAIGTPLDSSYAGSVTRGILSGKDRFVEVSVNSTTNDWVMKVLQTDASLNPGNSGGPLCDVSGNVIGVNTMKISENETEGIGFAIPIEDAMSIANRLILGESIKRPYLGISMADITTSTHILNNYGIKLGKDIHSGVIVMDVFDNSSCERAGIIKGDVIVSIDKYNIKNIALLKYYLSKFNPGDEIDIGIIRENENFSFKLVLDESN